MTLRLKLNLLLSTLLFTTLAAGLATLYVVRVSADKSRHVSRLGGRLVAIEDVRASILRWSYLASHPAERPQSLRDELRQSIVERLAILIRTAGTEPERKALQRIEQESQALIVAALAPDGDSLGQSETTRRLEALERRIDVLRSGYETESADALGDAAMAGFHAQVVAAGACVLVVAPAIWLILITRSSLIQPIRRLVEAANAIGAGNLDHKITVPGRNELSQLAEQVNQMAARLSDHQAKLLRARELAAIGELCTSVAHGIRNPLAGIRASAQVLSRRLPDRPDERERIAELIAEVDRLEARIACLLDFAHPKALVPQRVTIGTLVDTAAHDANRALVQARAEVVADAATRAVAVDVDPDQFAEVLAELFANAAEHMPDGGRITVAAAAQNGSSAGTTTVISVADTGTGIAPGGEEHVFDLFFTTRPGGTGVGLATARRVIENHGGRITLTSDPGRGTTVRIALHHP